MNSSHRLWGAAALSFALAAALPAQTSTTSSRPSGQAASTLKHGDKSFVEDAAKSGMEEIAISRVALEKASNSQVKEFARMMVSDHTGANAELMALAMAKNVVLPKEPNTEAWMKKKANGFDQDYMNKMVNDHQDAVKLFEKQAKNGADPELMAFASKTLPKLQAHLAQAKEIKKTVK